MSRCDFAYDDGAYVLGALSPADRAAYERHLVDCPACQQSVSEIAVLPGLLGRLDPASLEQFLPPPENPRVPELLTAARERRRRERQANRLRYAVIGLAAAAFALIVGFGVATVLPGEQPATPPSLAQLRMVEMEPVSGSTPVHAEIGFRGTDWGTEVTMHCGYDERAGYGKALAFRLVAHAADGKTEQIGSWRAAPGDDLRITGATQFTNAELVRLELIRADGTPVLAYDVR
ncbi:anti-sigma factor family protein [Micromonospora endophytica]|uniref:Anti-sigma factor n=1 Tax=Micromonospora endophytica TaxID=515350 RepID=A0A2W2DHS1_9ACTN|nr:zf-HC2 domain-containing protein [Micromonospora endophytica]PZF96736.1 anti-sigma factor [Micromonospora endophytica]RIW49197.1 anti-sigma factor [Micromonospora endophytica]BCJ59030.1 anti-sigma factor [Micromonospora endophytica]